MPTAHLENAIRSIPKSRWNPELRKSLEKSHSTILMAVIPFYFLLTFVDRVQFPDGWVNLLIARFVVLGIIGLCFFLFKQGKMNVHWMLAVPFAFIGAQSSMVFGLGNEDMMVQLNISMLVFFLGAGVLLVLEVAQAVLILGMSLGGCTYHILTSTQVEPEQWLAQGGQLLGLGVFLFILQTRLRYNSKTHAICSKIALADSFELLDEKNKGLEEAKLSLEGANAALGQSNVHLEEEVSRRTESLRKSNAERDQMVYRLSHDFKTPMVNVQSLVLLARNVRDEQKLDDIFNMIDSSLLQFGALVKDMDRFVTYTQAEIKKENFSLGEMVAKTWENVLKEYPSNMTLVADGLPETWVYTDPSKMRLVLDCVMTNAVQFEKKDGNPELRVKITQENHQVILSLEDNGKGIPKEVLPKVFDLFYRGNSISKGLGMGLYLSKSIMENLGGDIALESQGQGTSVHISLPVESV